jgi:hypothetical protein
VTGEWPPERLEVDHKDCDPSNNRWDNLRLATASQNQANKKVSRANTSGFKGVSWHKDDKRWRAQIRMGGKKVHLGSFDTPESAHRAYSEAAMKHYGEFARAK